MLLNHQYSVQKKQKRYYSGKKKRHTIKSQIIIDQDKRIICTNINKGRVHDFELFKRSKIELDSSIKISVDLGYLGIDKYVSNDIQIPKKSSKLKPLSKEEKRENKDLLSSRIIIEHINAKIKTFKILSQPYRNRRKRFGLRLNLICALINYDRYWSKNEF